MKRYNYSNVKNVKTTCKVGEITPVFWREVLPGDITTINMKNITRMVTPIVPVLDAPFIDIYTFFVPSRTLKPRRDINPVLAVDNKTVTNTMLAFRALKNNAIHTPFKEYFLKELNLQSSGWSIKRFCDWLETKDESYIKNHFQNWRYWTGETFYKGNFIEKIKATFCGTNLLEKFGLDQKVFFDSLKGTTQGDVTIDGSFLTAYHKICNDFFRNTDIEGTMKFLNDNFELSGVSIDNALTVASSGPEYTYDNFFALFTRRAPKKSQFLQSLYFNNPLSLTHGNGSTLNERLFQKLEYDNRILSAKGRLANAPYRETMQKVFREKFTDPNGAQFLSHFSFSQTVQEITSTAFSKTDDDEKFFLGDVGGKSVTYNEVNGLIKYNVNEPGYVISVAIPRFRVSFNNGTDFETFGKLSTRNDFYQPNLKASPFRAVYDTEVRSERIGWSSVGLQSSILGYTDAFNDYRTVNSAICGNFKQNNMSMWHFSEINPIGVYNLQFLKVNEEPLLRTLSVDTVDPFFMEFNWELNEQRIVPPVSVIDAEHRES